MPSHICYCECDGEGGGGGGSGTPPQIYALLTTGADTPTAAEFLADGVSSTTDEITVPAYTTNMYLHFWSIHSALTTIQQTHSIFNGRVGFADTPVGLAIDGASGYVYSSKALRFPVGERTWGLEA